jgi:hypothetical protein
MQLIARRFFASVGRPAQSPYLRTATGVLFAMLPTTITQREDAIMKRGATLLIGLSVIGFAALPCASTASAQSGDGWITLLDSKTMGDWDKLGETNWRMENGAVVADKRTSKTPAYLLSKKSYKDFMLHVEFWASNDANSGIFVRCSDPKKVGDKTCYEVNIFDQRKDPSYGTGAITRYVEVSPMPKAGGKWNTYEITMKGRDLTVVLNGKQTAKLRNGMYDQGPFALQHGAGTIKFRKVAIKPL